MHHETAASGTWRALSNEAASVIENAGRSIVAVHARRRIPSSGVHWRPGILVTADHTLERDEEIGITLPDGKSSMAMLAGRDPSTDLAVLKLDQTDLPQAERANITGLRVGNFILSAARTAEGGPRASMALVGVVGPSWRTWRGGVIDHTVRLDRLLHPNFSGGPALDDQGRVLGINTSGLSRYATVVIPASTVDRVSAELEKKGRIGHGYLGIGMQPVRLPLKLRDSLALPGEIGMMVVAVYPNSPAEKAGITLGDILVSLNSNPIQDVGDVQEFLAAGHIGEPANATCIRGTNLTNIVINVGERPSGKETP